ncbi:MAG: efflux RND transporter permease subunit [Hyphomicrobiales bacterium]|nr:efflux RND transporter permease subunit [Hyphomicrobiales bacterium]MBV9426704.1 efflux RND transporter permease subunit [Bradyrhizobiaceae bacterium]
MLPLNSWGLSGVWTFGGEFATLSDKSGTITYRFHARDVNLVWAPPEGKSFRFRVKIDGAPPAAAHGTDVGADGSGTVQEPRLYQNLDIDRDKAQVLGVKISDIFNALQSTLGTYYVNNFNVFGHTWQVNVQADTPFRQRTDDIDKIYVRNPRGGLVPLPALAQIKLVQGPQAVVRYVGTPVFGGMIAASDGGIVAPYFRLWR